MIPGSQSTDTLLKAATRIVPVSRWRISRAFAYKACSLVFCWLLPAVLFVDEYLNALTVGFSMSGITDSNKIPREHLALQVHLMACSLCMTIPLTSWTAFTIGLIGDYGMDFSDYLKAVICLVSSSVPGTVIPVLTFLVVGFIVFASRTCWIVMLITMPIFIPLAAAAGASKILTLAALMSGVGAGYTLCFYADTVFMTTASTGVGNITIIQTILPYSMIMMALSGLGYLALGCM